MSLNEVHIFYLGTNYRLVYAKHLIYNTNPLRLIGLMRQSVIQTHLEKTSISITGYTNRHDVYLIVVKLTSYFHCHIYFHLQIAEIHTYKLKVLCCRNICNNGNEKKII